MKHQSCSAYALRQSLTVGCLLRTPFEKLAEPKARARGFRLAVCLAILAAASVAYPQQSNSVPRIVLVIPSPAEAQIELTDASVSAFASWGMSRVRASNLR